MLPCAIRSSARRATPNAWLATLSRTFSTTPPTTATATTATTDHAPSKQSASGESAGSWRGIKKYLVGKRQPEYVPGTTIRVFRKVADFREWRKTRRHMVGLVPTMGALHGGHLSLIKNAAVRSDDVVVSIYVNPSQFGIKEDLASYPKTWDQDMELLKENDRALHKQGTRGRIVAVFAPTTNEMYPSGFPGQEIDSKGSFVTITPEGEILEGARRPTFFRGVATVCMKLFNIVQPNIAVFGQKDVQQTVVIKKMVKDFCLPLKILVSPTIRTETALANSSRNAYLGPRRLKVAPVLFRALSAARDKYFGGETSAAEILAAAHDVLNKELETQKQSAPDERVIFDVEYISLGHPETLAELDAVEPSQGAIISAAIKMHTVEAPQEGEDLGDAGGPAVRLIDNIFLRPRESRDGAGRDQQENELKSGAKAQAEHVEANAEGNK